MRESSPSRVLLAYSARADSHPEEVLLAQISQCGGGLSVVLYFHGHVASFFPDSVIADFSYLDCRLFKSKIIMVVLCL